MAPTIDRRTQFDMLGLKEADQLIKSREQARPHNVGPPGPNLQEDDLTEKRAPSLDQYTLETHPKIYKARSTPEESMVKSALQLRTRREAPWNQYEKIYEVELAGSVAVAVRKSSPAELVHIRTFAKVEGEKALYMFKHLQHQNIVTALDAFATDDGLYVVLERMPVSLEQVVASPAYPNEHQLAAIIGQVHFTSGKQGYALITFRS